MSQINLPITLIAPEFPNGYCPTPQQLANDIASGMLAYIPGAYNTFNYGSGEPVPNDRLKPWFRIFEDGTPDRWYVYQGGNWLAPHPCDPSSSEVRMWKGTEDALVTYDGGAAGSVTDRTGPMWQVDHDFDAKFPIGPGTLPSTTILAVGDTGGEEKHSLLVAEMPPHSHVWTPSTSTANGNNADAAGGLLSLNATSGPNRKLYNTSEVGGAGDPAVVVAHNNMPPYRAVFMIRRTARVYYTPNL